jgi:hypothetical protein
MASSLGTLDVSIKPEDVMYTSINTSKDGYNSARLVMNAGKNAYLSVSFEWQDDVIPDFVLEMMSFMQRSGMETSGVWEGREEDYKEFSKIK